MDFEKLCGQVFGLSDGVRYATQAGSADENGGTGGVPALQIVGNKGCTDVEAACSAD